MTKGGVKERFDEHLYSERLMFKVWWTSWSKYHALHFIHILFTTLILYEALILHDWNSSDALYWHIFIELISLVLYSGFLFKILWYNNNHVFDKIMTASDLNLTKQYMLCYVFLRSLKCIYYHIAQIPELSINIWVAKFRGRPLIFLLKLNCS